MTGFTLIYLSTPAISSETVTTALVIESLDMDETMSHINALSGEIGIRVAGSENESRAADYIARELESYGYLASLPEPIPLHNGLTTRNVWAEVPGQRDEIMIIGAHYDTKNPSPGANDNASGVAVVLELARVLSKVTPPYTVRFVFFGAEEIIDGQSKSLYMFTFWDTVCMMLIGMALLRLGILNAERSVRFYLGLMAVGYGIGLSINAYEIDLLLSRNFSPRAVQQAYISYDLGRLFVSLGHVGLVMLICRRGWMQWLTSSCAAVGQMALTNYVMHSVICGLVFFGIGFSMFGEMQRYELYYVVAAICLFQLLISKIWLDKYRFGPLEWCWRSLTYLKKQKMRR